jgi:phosphoenolpyruvate-protein kinase (PTS system EI component)
MEIIKGIPVSPGVVIGRAFVLDDPVRHIPYRTVAQEDVPRQRDRLTDAIALAITDLSKIARSSSTSRTGSRGTG